jgi:excisionase family DNA binding protein
LGELTVASSIRLIRKQRTAPPPGASTPPQSARLPAVKEAAAYVRPLELLTIKEAAAFAKVSTQSVRRWIKAGLLKIYRAGRQTRIDESELVNLLSLQDLM